MSTSSMSNVRIYPKENQESEAQSFLEIYELLQTLIKSRSLLTHLNDDKNQLIPTASSCDRSNEENMEQIITIELYKEAKASKLLEFKERVTITEQWRYFPLMYRSLQTRMPPNVKNTMLANHPDIKTAVTAWNKSNQTLPQIELELTDQRVQQFIMNQFRNAYEHFSIPVTQLEETYIQIHTRVNNQLGLKSTVTKRMEAHQNKINKQVANHQVAINDLNNLFTVVLGDVTPDISALVENREYSKAYNKYLQYHLVTKDRSYVIIKLERNMIDLSYDTSIDNNYTSFMDRFIHTHALYLFVQWHNHFTIDELKLIVAGTDQDFQTKHAKTIKDHDLTLPCIVCDHHKYMLLQRALMGSHLHSSLNTYNQQNIQSATQSSFSSSTTTNTSQFSQLNKVLIGVDARMQQSERKSSDSHVRLDNRKPKENCKMCIMAKTKLMINNIKYHSEGTPCPDKNIELISMTVTPHTKLKSTVTDSNKPGKYVPQPLPAQFNSERECSHCWRSGQAEGFNSQTRAREHTEHSTRNCPYARQKRDHNLFKSQHSSNSSNHASSPRMAHGDKRTYSYHRDDNYHPYDHRSKREQHSGAQSSSASSVTSSIRSQDTEVYDNRDRDHNSRHPHDNDYDHYRDTRSRSRDRDSRDRRDHDYRRDR